MRQYVATSWLSRWHFVCHWRGAERGKKGALFLVVIRLIAM
jgi:hypothetical protein